MNTNDVTTRRLAGARRLTPRVAPTHGSGPRVQTVVKLCLAFVAVVIFVAAAQMVWAGYHLYSGGQALNSALAETRSPAAMKNVSRRNLATENSAMPSLNFMTPTTT